MQRGILPFSSSLQRQDRRSRPLRLTRESRCAMVYPRRDRSLSLAKLATLCAANVLLLQGSALAKPPAATPTVAPTTCLMAPSSGDIAAGINIVTDSKCSKGGVGCIDNICRYCKTADTQKSGHLLACDKVTSAPTTASPAATAGPPVVTGSPAVTSASPQVTTAGPIAPPLSSTPPTATTAPPVSTTAAPVTTTAPPVSTTAAPVTTTAPPVSTTAAPVTTTAPPVSTTAAPVTTTAPPVSTTAAPVTTTAPPVSTTAAPVTTTAPPVSTTAAPVTTTAPPVLTTAAPVTTTAPPVSTTAAPVTTTPGTTKPSAPVLSAGPKTCVVAQSDFDAGVNAVYDPSCASGGLGCFSSACRYCKRKQTPHSSHLNDCGLYGAPTTAPPVPSTTAPPVATTTVPPVVPTATPVVTTAIPASVIETGCPYSVASGDLTVGIQLVGDSTCIKGGVGCYKDICRYCQFAFSEKSKYLTLCSALGYDFSGIFNPADIGEDDVPATTAPTPAPTPVSTSTSGPPPGAVSTGCAFAASGGDIAVGIQLVGDLTCKSGGVGCFKDVCRYCQFKTTDQSAHLIACKDLGYNFGPLSTAPSTTTVAPAVTTASPPSTVSPGTNTGCPYLVSDGDYAVGIQLVGDATCTVGGVGCFKDVCRYCQYKTTAQSAHLTMCKDLGYVFGGSSSTPATTAPVTVAPPAPTSAAPVGDTGCPYAVSDGDFAVGIQLVGDATCASGGVGCFKDVCRYCKYKESDKSSHLMPCGDLGYSLPTFAPADNGNDETGCPYDVSAGDLAVGIQLVGDATCVNGGVGCFEGICRFCQFRTTAQSGHLSLCKDLGYTFNVPTPSPTPTTATPAPVPTSIAETGCPYAVTEGDYAVGIELVGDATCAKGGLGCHMDICRYCKFAESPQSKHLMACKDLGYTFTDAPTFHPADDGGDVTPAPAPKPNPKPNPKTGCVYDVSDGDLAVGIQLVADATCKDDGVGCFGGVCRFCQFRTTAQSAHLTTCQSLGYNFEGTVPGPTTAAPTPVPPPIPETGCPYAVSDGNFAVGIQLVGDTTCKDGGLGCFLDKCRYCKFEETAQSKHLVSCGDLGYSFTAQPTFKPSCIGEDGVGCEDPAPVTGCAYEVSGGDYAVGIQLVGDSTCANGGLGCFQGVCRYCKFKNSAQSSHLLSCKSLGYDFGGDAVDNVPTAAPTPVPPPIAETGCPYPVSGGDLAVGIQLVGDKSCKDGGLGCHMNICRYCKYEETAQSKHLLSCDALGYPFTAQPTFKPSCIDEDGVDCEDPDTGCAYTVSGGDLAVGIQLVGDSTCADGGLGCFQGVCRYCQFKTTAQSGHLLQCKDLGYSFGSSSPTPTTPATSPPSPNTGCSFSVSDGDYAVGIQLVGDATCASGGVGCFEKVCRYCQYKSTAQSAHLFTCASLGYNFGSSVTPAPTTKTPASTTCKLAVSEGDFAVGVQIATDHSCAAGGVGCIDDTCRFCKFRDTPQSASFPWCDSLTLAPSTEDPIGNPNDIDLCPHNASEGDQAVGIEVISDESCKDGGVGCFEDVCRYCWVTKTDKSAHLNPCSDYGYTPAPVTAPPAPTSAPSNSPVTATPSAGQCSFTVSEGDQNVGISVVTDVSCLSGGIGCLDNSVCRLCKIKDSAQSTHLNWCDAINGASPAVTTTAPAPATTTGAPGASPAVTTTAPAPATTTGAPSPAATTQAPPVAASCTETASEGDKAVGINIVTDVACLSGGLGCMDNSVCRHCKTKDTAQSSHLEWCDKLTGTTPAATTVASSTAPSTAPAPATTTQTPVLTGACTEQSSEGDKAVGIDIVTDRSCASGGVGCVDNSMCRYCKTKETQQSGHLVWCSSITGATPVATTAAPVVTAAPPAQTTAPVVTAAPVATTAVPIVCDQQASEGNLAAGINIETATSCVNGGVGCIADTVCRYCKLKETADSSHLEWCSTGVVLEPGLPAPTTTLPPIIVTGAPAPEPTHDPLTCSTEVAIGDEEGGVAAIHDETCLEGGVGCFGGVCRFCQVFLSDKSKDFLPCPEEDSLGPRFSFKEKPKALANKVESNLIKSESVSLTSGKDKLDEMLKNKTFKWSISAAACVGAIAIVALMTIGVKRLRRGSSQHVEDSEEEDKEEGSELTEATSTDPEGEAQV